MKRVVILGYIMLVCMMLFPVSVAESTVVWEESVTIEYDASIYEVLRDDSRFSHIELAIHKVGLHKMLHQNGKFTVFAPTNRAFGVYPSEMIRQTIVNAPATELRQAVLYHIVPGEYEPQVLEKMTSLRTAFGETLEVRHENDQIILNGNTTVHWKAIATENGIIYVIDNFLLPPSSAY